MESRKQLRLGSINSLQRSVRHVKRYNVLVVGESRLGKTTIIQQLLQTQRISKARSSPADNKVGPFACRKESIIETMLLKHKRSKLVLSLIETPGFGPSSMGTDCWQPVMDEIKGRISKYMSEENSINRRIVVDHRIHCCIYFLSPFASGLRPVDIEFMKTTCKLVNIIPVIAKVDTMTTQECKKLKVKIIEDCEKNDISIFNPELFDLQNVDDTGPFQIAPPYSVIGGDAVVYSESGQKIGRQYPWGFAEVNNEEHCDYITLHDILLKTCIEDFIEYTDNVLYENYRMNHLKSLDLNSSIDLIDNNSVSEGPGEKEALLREKQYELEKLKRHIEQINRRMSDKDSLMEVSSSDRDSILSSTSSDKSMEKDNISVIPESTL
ncbi:septin-2B-like isoform X3 [Bolinopsis microptera]